MRTSTAQDLVAIKTLLPSLAANPTFQRGFLREAYLGTRVAHPNVCAVYELGHDENSQTPFIAMQWIEGGSLCDLMSDGIPLEGRLAARIAADTCAALHALHEVTDARGQALEAVHLDVSPENILLSLCGTVKLTDFGISRMLASATEAEPLTDWVLGKAHYMSPEQALGEALDRRADVFAIGCVLYQMTTGCTPFSGATLLDTVRAVIRGRFAPPTSTIDGYPPSLARIVERALAPNPNDRFATAAQLQLELEDWLANYPVMTKTHIGTVIRERFDARVDTSRAQQVASCERRGAMLATVENGCSSSKTHRARGTGQGLVAD